MDPLKKSRCDLDPAFDLVVDCDVTVAGEGNGG
jgi:hypothetical protein